MVVNGLAESGSSARRRHPRLAGTLVGLGVFALVAKPAFWSGLIAVFAFSSFKGSGPDPLFGAFWALSALVLLALPVITGVLVATAISGSGRSVMALSIQGLLLYMVVLRFIWTARTGEKLPY
jgi:ABC-type dipeptide/oligopeptide/nickel transport system permease component